MLHPLQAAPFQRALLHPLLRALHLPAQPKAPVPGLPVQRLQDLLLLQQEGQSLALLSVPEGQVSVVTHPQQRREELTGTTHLREAVNWLTAEQRTLKSMETRGGQIKWHLYGGNDLERERLKEIDVQGKVNE